MRLAIIPIAVLALSACASVPTSSDPIPSELAAVEGAPPGVIAAGQADHLFASQQAQLRDIAEAETRVDLARARLDFATVRDRRAEDGDVREFLDARRALRDARNVYGPTDTGRREWALRPFSYGRHRPRRGPGGYWGNGVVGTFGLSQSREPDIGTAMPLSGLSGG